MLLPLILLIPSFISDANPYFFAQALNGGRSRINTSNGWKAIEVISQNDSRGSQWTIPGDLDGGGAYLYDNDNKIRIHVNHELTRASISEVNLNKNRLMEALSNKILYNNIRGVQFVIDARLAYDRWTTSNGRNWRSSDATNFCRFCSSQEYEPNTFGPGRGFVDQIYITGEECRNGRLFALDSVNRDFYQLSGVTGSDNGPGTGGMAFDKWENAALIDTGETEHIALLLSADGDGDPRTLKLYIGRTGKDVNGSDSNGFLARNGLAFGQWFHLDSSFPGTGQTRQGTFSNIVRGQLIGGKLEDVDTNPNNPTQVVMAEEGRGIYVLDFDLRIDPRNGMNIDNSRFSITKVNTSGIRAGDNVDWSVATGSDAQGRIFVTEDSGRGAIWSMRPDGSNKVMIGTTNSGGEPTGIFDLSSLVDYPHGTILVCMNQGNPGSMTLLISPDAMAPVADIAEIGMQTPADVNIPAEAIVYEAEAPGTIKYMVDISTQYPGYTGGGFVDFGGQGAFVEWTVNVEVEGVHEFFIRYASANNARFCSFLVDGSEAAELAFQGSRWSEWRVETVSAQLTQGRHQIKILAAETSGANVDSLAVLAPQRQGSPQPVDIQEMKFEAEDATLKSCQVSTSRDGFNGRGFVDFLGRDASVQWDFTVSRLLAIYEISFRYAANADRPAELIVNGQKQSPPLEFAQTGSWSTWRTETREIVLSEGQQSIIVDTGDLSSGPNLDWMSLRHVEVVGGSNRRALKAIAKGQQRTRQKRKGSLRMKGGKRGR